MNFTNAPTSKTCTLSRRNTIWGQLFLLALMLLLNFSIAIAQNGNAEMFHPKTKQRTSKLVKAYLPFHEKSQMVSVEFVDGMAIMEGDIVLGPSILYSGEVQLAVAIDGDSYRWPNGVIPYTIENGHPKRQAILEAIQHIQQRTNIRLIPRSNQKDYAHFINGDGCWSRVGRVGGKQKINIGSCGFGSIVHEILHTAGLWHEQSRSDRDHNVRILWDNIESDKKHNFKKHISDGIDIGNYDCKSIMHYSAYAFSKNGKPTIVGKTCSSFGQRSAMSRGDIDAINDLYRSRIPEGLTRNLWHLTARHSRKAIDIRGGSLSPKANVQQYELNKSNAQKFRFISAGGGYYYIQNIGSDLVLDVQGGVARPFTNVWQYPKNNTDAQKWRLVEAGNGYYFIRSKLGEFNLEVQSASTNNGANIRIATTSGGTSQRFKFQEASTTPVVQAKYVKPLELYWSRDRTDNFTTASVTGKNNAKRSNYRYVRVAGYVLNKSSSSEGLAVPLYLYYHPGRKDHFTVASRDGIRAAVAAGYRRVATEGYVLKSVKPIARRLYKPLWLYYHSGRKDNFVTATTQGMKAAEAAGYRKVRIEGYVRIDNRSRLPVNTVSQVAGN